MNDKVNHPEHYTQAGIECIDAITAAVTGKSGIEAVCVANVIKYLWRYELKNGVEDVKKAQWYLNRLVSELEGEEKPAVTADSVSLKVDLALTKMALNHAILTNQQLREEGGR